MTTMETTPQLYTEENDNPWKSCDLRGLYLELVSVELFRSVGSAIGTMLNRDARVLVAGDFRLSTPELKQGLIEGLVATGLSPLDGGKMPTPVAYFISEYLVADAVLIVTASHNPADHNGLKLMIGGIPTTSEQLSKIRTLAESAKFRPGTGESEKIELVELYERKMIERWRHLDPESFTNIVIAAGNCAWSVIATRVFRSLGFNVHCLSCFADGSFPDRPAECSRTANLSGL